MGDRGVVVKELMDAGLVGIELRRALRDAHRPAGPGGKGAVDRRFDRGRRGVRSRGSTDRRPRSSA